LKEFGVKIEIATWLKRIDELLRREVRAEERKRLEKVE
jgi:hypothetical protein